MSKDLTLDEKVLLAGWELEIHGKAPFSAEDLVIAAWRKFPDAFGLEGYGKQYPDSNRVFTKIMGEKGLRGRGWLLKSGEKFYQLSEAGKLYAKSLSEGRTDTPSRSALDRKQKDILQGLLQSKAVTKVRTHLSEEITFLDACSFWDISPRSTSATLTARLATVESLLKVVDETLREQASLVFVHGGLAMTREDLDLLKATHTLLSQRFEKELRIIGSRKDDRKLT